MRRIASVSVETDGTTFGVVCVAIVEVVGGVTHIQRMTTSTAITVTTVTVVVVIIIYIHIIIHIDIALIHPAAGKINHPPSSPSPYPTPIPTTITETAVIPMTSNREAVGCIVGGDSD